MGRKSEKYKFIVDTNSYSGNFEREMMAYATGLAVHRGQEYAAGFEEEFPELFKELENIVVYCGEHDDVANIETTPGVWSNGMGFHYVEGQEEEAIQKRNEHYIADVEKYNKINTETMNRIIGGENPWPWNKDFKPEETIAGYKRDIKRRTDELPAKLSQPLGKCPAYQSVAMVFSKKPSDAALELMIKRCKEFPKLSMHPDYRNDYKKIEITGFRLVKEEKVVVEKEIKTWT